MARKAVAGEASTVKSPAGKALPEEGTQGQLIRASPSLKRLFAQALERGVVTVDEISAALPGQEISPNQLDELIALLEDMGVTIGRDEDGSVASGAKSHPESAESEAETIPISDARQNLAELCNRVAYGGERLLIARRGKARVALVSVTDLELLEALEDAIDLAAARKALREAEDVGTKPFLEVLRELGIDTEVA
jgi:prevent-host-death family protein